MCEDCVEDDELPDLTPTPPDNCLIDLTINKGLQEKRAERLRQKELNDKEEALKIEESINHRMVKNYDGHKNHPLHQIAHDMFDYINKACMSSQLPKLCLFWSGPRIPELGIALMHVKIVKKCYIMLSSSITSNADLFHVLAHEMIHCYAECQAPGKSNIGYPGANHGSFFQKIGRQVLSDLIAVENEFCAKFGIDVALYGFAKYRRHILLAKSSLVASGNT